MADRNNYRIQVFADDGSFVINWGTFGTEPGQFNLPYSVAVGVDGSIYVADSSNNRIQKFAAITTGSGDGVTPALERFMVYPNPATNKLTVEAGGMGDEVMLYDLLGRAVIHARLSSGRAFVDVWALPAGAYVVRVGSYTQRITLSK